MKKIQKIWLVVFCAMFLIPEILWNPVAGTFAYLFRLTPELYQLRGNFLSSARDGLEYLYILFGIVLIIQFVGILGAFIILIKKSVKFKLKTLIVFMTSMILLATAISTLLYIGIICYSFSGGTFFSMMG
ncbi:MAG TPA: hypothetical protein VMD74_00160 [Candidatus Methylomirabilis sp.]|nr:hypothetical protein [Candidatus Methylomirabilis sp.]